MSKLAKINKQTVIVAPKLTDKTSSEFLICFKTKLEKKFNFSKLERKNLKALQGFLDKVSELSFSDVDKAWLRTCDKNDKFGEFQIVHYEVNKAFRLHGYICSEMFCVFRIDPNHKVHK